MKTFKNLTRIAAALGLMAAGSVAAQTLTMTDPSGLAGSQQSVQFNYTAGGDVAVIIFNTDLSDPNTIISTPSFQQFDAGTSAFVACDGTNRFASFSPIVQIQCSQAGLYTVQGSAPTATVPSFSNLARVQFTIAGGATAGQTATYSYDANCGAGEFPNTDDCTEFTNTSAARVTGDVSDTGVVTVASVPPVAPNVAFVPNGGTVNIPAGAPGTIGSPSGSATIQVNASGGAGAGTASYSCTVPMGFVVTNSSNPSIAVGADPADMSASCTLGASQNTGSMPCSVTDGNGTRQVNFSLVCPAGTPVPTPEYTSVPAPGGTINCSGAPGSTTTGTLTINNTGIAGAGSDLTYTCTEPPTANFTITAGGMGTVPVGGTAQVQIQCTTPAMPGDPDNTDTLACTTNDSGGTDGIDESSVSYNLVAGVVTAPPPVVQPNVIPVNSLWSKLMLVGLLLGLGGVALTLRRS